MYSIYLLVFDVLFPGTFIYKRVEKTQVLAKSACYLRLLA